MVWIRSGRVEEEVEEDEEEEKEKEEWWTKGDIQDDVGVMDMISLLKDSMEEEEEERRLMSCSTCLQWLHMMLIRVLRIRHPHELGGD